MEEKLKKKLLSAIQKFKKSRILIIGDLILDRYLSGEVSRISPEAFVLVVEVKKNWIVPGGAGNVVNNLCSLGAQVIISGLIGKDYYGDKIKKILKAEGADVSGIFVDNNRPTILKTRIIARNQQVVRVDVETRKKIHDELICKIQKFINSKKNEIDAIILSDYGKGLITPEIIESAVKIKNEKNIPLVVDPKIEHFKYYKNITIMTPNKKEASEGSGLAITDERSLYKVGKTIKKELNLEALLITRSEEGMTLFEDDCIFNIPTEATEVYDVTGAGDTVVSVLTLCLSCGCDFKSSAVLANIAAGEVVKELGTTTIKPNQLINLVKNYKYKAIVKL
ncbi:MAG TPA: D-glycero-beta-D-manno-heptose-7-phosphate kinase [bacterium]|nr:D-glycero-beta-D-manno-heptose-7-phosphate kinase [bacterium]